MPYVPPYTREGCNILNNAGRIMATAETEWFAERILQALLETTE